MKFVVQEHFASHHHFDFRLELKGVARSWAVPKGMPETVGEKRLGLQVGNHSISYMSFTGEIPRGEYGAGTVLVFDEGECRLLGENDGFLKLYLTGKKLKGIYTLTRFEGKQWKKWLITKEE